MAAAIAASLADAGGGGSDFTFAPHRPSGGDVDNDLNDGNAKRHCAGAGTSGRVATTELPETLLDESAGVATLAVKLPDNQKLVAKFGLAQPVSTVVEWVAAQGWDMSKHVLSLSFPTKAIDDVGESLKGAGVTGPRDMLHLRPR